MRTRREIEIEATPEEVWEALATEEGRERWLEDEPEREIHVETADAPHRLVWWWWPATSRRRASRCSSSPLPPARAWSSWSPSRAVPARRAGAPRSRSVACVSDAIGPSSRRSPTRRAATWSRRSCARARPACRRSASALPISRQAIAKHLAALDEAGLVERAPGRGREVRYRLRPGALRPASAWLGEAAAAWDGRLGRLKRASSG